MQVTKSIKNIAIQTKYVESSAVFSPSKSDGLCLKQRK
jgi:hypothetical protein